ncbi:MAG: GNAT family N-acetyltransferase [Sandaracinaceae bacterium]
MRTLRPATDHDCPRLSAVARAAKAHWGYPQAWLDLWVADLTYDASRLADERVLCAEDGGEVVGFVAWRRDGEEAEIEGLWVEPGAMGRGHGRALMEAASVAARAEGVRALRIVADPNAVEFYRRLGAVDVGAEASVPAGRELPVLRLELG